MSARSAWIAFLVVGSLVVIGVVTGVLLVGEARADEQTILALSRRPLLHAMLNGTCALLLSIGFLFIRAGRRLAHLSCMLAATAVSGLFLVSYLQYHANVGSVPFIGVGWSRPVYFAILITHAVLAAVIVPLVLAVLWHALMDQRSKHRRIARWALPIWLYVSVTGVLVYLFAHVWFGQA